MNEPISVVVTCYNLERYIGSAIESVLSQSYCGEVEILVVDDCSTDGSAAIISRYPGVRMLRTPNNCGVLLATVLGLRESSHDIVAFLDGDDLWRSDKLEMLAAAFCSTPELGFATHDLRYIDSVGSVIQRVSRPSQVMPPGATPAECDRLIRTGILEQGDYVWLGSAFAIRRSVVDAKGFCAFAECLPDPRHTYQDWPLAVWCAAQQGVRMGYLHEKLFDYRLHRANHSGDARTPEKAIRNVNRTLNTLRAVENIVRRRGPLSPRVDQAIAGKRQYYQYLLDLYQGKRMIACRGFLASQAYIWRSGGVRLKEVARFVGVQLLGLHRFLRWAGRA